MSLDLRESGKHCDTFRRTVVAVIITPTQEVLLVLPKKARRHGWIFPQGGMSHVETIRMAVLREIREELGYQSSEFEKIVELEQEDGRVCSYSTEQKPKQYFPVGLVLRHWRMPELNHENRKWCTAAGPNCVWTRVGECSVTKRTLIVSCLKAAVKQNLLHSSRWQDERLQPFSLHAV